MREDLGDENRCTRRPSEVRCDQGYHCFKAQMLWGFFFFLLMGVDVVSASLISGDSKCSNVI